ncbi:MAG: T9SS type A sorting domain-containing protein, partial [Flavobacteriales bacterium]
EPFVNNTSNMPAGAYVLKLTDLETGCQMSYHLLIESEDCCEITLIESAYDGCLAKYKFNVDSECESPTINVVVLDPNGTPVAFDESFWAGVQDVSFETTIEGDYTVDITVFCESENPCGNISVSVTSDPECSSTVEPDCFAIWDDEVVNNYRMEGNALIAHPNSNTFSVLGSVHDVSSGELNYYWTHLDLESNNIAYQAFGNAALTTSTDEYVLDAVEHNGYIYNVGYGQYDDGNGMHECLMISKIDLADGSLSASKRYSLSNSSNERATSIDTYVNSNGETQLIVAGYTDLDFSRGVNAFATSFSLSLDITTEFFLYDVNNRDNFVYEVKNVSQASVFVLVGKGMIGPSTFEASALMLDYNFNIVDEFTFYKKPSEITSVAFDGNELYFVGNYIADVDENITKAMIFKTGLSWDSNTSFTTLENTGDSETFDWARDIVIHDSELYIAGQSGLGGTRGLLIKVDPGEGELEEEFQVVWSKQTTTKHTTLKAISDILNSDGSSSIIAVGDTQSQGEDAIAVVHSDLDGNTCCLETTTVITDQVDVELTTGYTRGFKTPNSTNLLTGSANYATLPMCDPLLKSAEVALMVSSPNASLNVVPNPNDGQFELMLSAQGTWLTEVVIIDATGQEIFKSKYPAKDHLRSVSLGSNLGLKSGMYLLHVRLSNGEELSTRVVVGRQ